MGTRHRLHFLTAVVACVLICSFASTASAAEETRDEKILRLFRAHRQGKIVPDGQALHLAIDGIGYFQLRNPANGELLYTRRGAFFKGPRGQMQTAEGYLIEPSVTIEPEITDIMLGEDGTVWAFPGPAIPPDPANRIHFLLEYFGNHEIARLSLSRFSHPEQLEVLPGHPGFFRASPASGEPETVLPWQEGMGFLIANALEDPVAVPLADSGCKNRGQTVRNTGWPLDLLIEGQGFFALLNPFTGESFFTRQGHFEIVSDKLNTTLLDFPGTFISPHGYLLVGTSLIAGLPSGASNDGLKVLQPGQVFNSVAANGVIKIKEANGTEHDFSRITLAVFDDLSVLEPVSSSRQTLYRVRPELQATGGNYKPRFRLGLPGEQGVATLKSGSYEDCGSDVISVEPVSLSAP
ncbi:MAG: hypothetical protein ACAI44_12920 [Candidatus Sericytochromatia bacterium]